MAYLFLAISIVGELIGTSMLKASEGFTRLYPTLFTIVAFVVSFFFISLSLKTLPLNMTYAIWSGVGAVATTLISVLIWKEKNQYRKYRRYCFNCYWRGGTEPIWCRTW